ncbi:MBL fold metallo-hydrolase [Desulfurobacterium sp.]
MEIKVLGSYGHKGDSAGTTCFQLSPSVLIDAGSIFKFLDTDPLHIDHIFLSHSHLDHIADIPFLLDVVFSTREKPIKIYGHKETIAALKNHLLNHVLWPDFNDFLLPSSGNYPLEYIEIEPFEQIKVNGFTIIPFPSVHPVPTFGYVIKKGEKAVLYTSDTFKNPTICELLKNNPDINSLIIDVSFPSYFAALAENSGHLTPAFLEEIVVDMKKNIKREINLYAFHIKPTWFSQTVEEIKNIVSVPTTPLIGGETIKI